MDTGAVRCQSGTIDVYKRQLQPCNHHRYRKNCSKDGYFNPVSYTHLDVYKRQPIDNVSNYDSSKEDIVFIAPLMDVEKHKLIFGTKSAMIKPVSYTHLDVYKRQDRDSELPWVVQSFVILRYSLWMSLYQTLMQSFVYR